MRRIPLMIAVAILIASLLPQASLAQQDATPTAPPPPVEPTNTQPPSTPRPPTEPPPRQPSRTPTWPPGGYATRTPTITLTPVVTATATLSATATLTATETPTPTPTPVVTYLGVLIYMDINNDNVFNRGEGVENLWVVVTQGNGSGWDNGAMTQAGLAAYVLPESIAPNSTVLVQIPYLHISREVRAAKEIGGSVAVEIRLEAPRIPIVLP